MFNYSLKPGLRSKLELFSDYGFRYLHWCDDWNEARYYTKAEMENYRQLLDAAGVTCLDVHAVSTVNIKPQIDSVDKNLLEEYVRLLENRITFCSVIGCDSVVVHPPGVSLFYRTGEPIKSSLNEDEVERLRQGIKISMNVFERVRPLCENLSVTIAVENAHPEDPEIIKRYFDRFPPEFIGFCFDSGHANLTRNFDRLKDFRGRLRVLHLHDNRGVRDDHQPPFWGTVDWKSVMEWIRSEGYPKPLNFEITHNPKLFHGGMREYLTYAKEAINKLLNEV